MSARLRSLVPVAAISVVAALALAAPAGAGSYETFKTTVGISGKYPAFSGKLSSGNGYCKGYRKVKLWSEKGGPDKLLGTTTSDSYGNWAIDVSAKLSSGAYYASVTAKKSTEVAVACKAGTSKVIAVD
ncbi:MAG: hypothetical protein JJE35_15795 [Thermoleophilia bacterium]|nr:hypothetical protein [Thermoleophilia bacterium]